MTVRETAVRLLTSTTVVSESTIPATMPAATAITKAVQRRTINLKTVVAVLTASLTTMATLMMMIYDVGRGYYHQLGDVSVESDSRKGTIHFIHGPTVVRVDGGDSNRLLPD